MSSSYAQNPDTSVTGLSADYDGVRPSYTGAEPVTSETKPSFKTTELIAYVVVAIAVLVASAVVDNGSDGQGFSADHAWFFVTLLTIGYMISRGLAKSGSYAKDQSKNDTAGR